MTFESLVHDERLASQLTTTALGLLKLDRPDGVRIVDATGGGTDRTKIELEKAHTAATEDGIATLLHGLTIPFTGFENEGATDVLPDFAIVARQTTAEDEPSSWLIIGDAKDYERVRSRIDDGRMLKGFLQVALGAESAASWSKLPDHMSVHDHGVLAVPRNAFLQPTAVIELLDDHREEVRMRVAQRRAESESVSDDAEQLIEGKLPAAEFVAHLEATFDPSSCRSCALFSFCRNELRQSSDPNDLLIELGIPELLRPHLKPLVAGSETVNDYVPESVAARVRATVDGVAQKSHQARVDQAGQPGSINVVVAKSDSSAVGIYGIGTQLVTASGTSDWSFEVLDDPQSSDARRRVMGILGKELDRSLADREAADSADPDPVHLVVPDGATIDVLTSIADNLAGVELSRIGWERDVDQGREPLTFGGLPAEMPPVLEEPARTGVSFLLEEDRARAFSLRCPVVNVRSVLARHVTAGGPEIESFRLDYLVQWADATGRVDHRELSDLIEDEEHTPGARLTKKRSDAIHSAFVGTAEGSPRPADPGAYRDSILEELSYKAGVLDRAISVLNRFPDSNLRKVHRIMEGDAQTVWRRRHLFHASDLVRFGRTTYFWRNALAPKIESDAQLSEQLLALTNPRTALDRARDAGTRAIAAATVVSVDPIVLDIDSRQFRDDDRAVLLHVGTDPAVEAPDVRVKVQKGGFRISGMAIGPLNQLDTDDPHRFEWSPAWMPELEEGDRLVVANRDWFEYLKGNKLLPLPRLDPDDTMAPKVDCQPGDYVEDPDAHRWCCRPHEAAETERADEDAVKRANGELNPEVWPPVVDRDGFEVSSVGAAEGDPADRPAETAPVNLTLDDLD